MTPEQKFLHDISSPVNTAEYSMQNAIGALEKNSSSEAIECMAMLKVGIRNLEKVAQMIHERRASLEKGK